MKILIIKWLRRTFASLLFLGYIPGAPGTIGSAVTVAALWQLQSRIPALFYPSLPLAFWLTALALTAVSIFLSNDSEFVFGRRDAKQIIIDEAAGQFLAFFMVPISWRTLLLGFVLFRLVDIVKPFPVHRFEELEDGVGVTMDDVAAGVLTNISIHATIWIYHVISTWL